MPWKKVLVAFAALAAFTVALWLGFLGLSKIDSREVQTAAIAAVSSLAGAIVASASSYWMDRIRRSERSQERFEDETLSRLNRFQSLQWDASTEIESLVFKLTGLALRAARTRPTDAESADRMAAECEDINRTIAALTLRLGPAEAPWDFIPLNEVCRDLCQQTLSEDQLKEATDRLGKAQVDLLTHVGELRLALTFVEYAAVRKNQTEKPPDEA